MRCTFPPPFTNGHRCYSRRSKNSKGDYYYYHCGLRQRASNAACDCSTTIREDLLIAAITRAFDLVFEDAEAIIAQATAEAEQMLDSNRQEVARIKSQLTEIDKEIASLTRLLVHPDMEDAARKAIIRQNVDPIFYGDVRAAAFKGMGMN